MSKTNSPKRPRGAQPNNTNAVKHGFYSRQFHGLETQDLDSALWKKVMLGDSLEADKILQIMG